MDANATSVLEIFERRVQLEVPLFQRQYVWKQEEHWEPLWEDIERKFSEYLGGRRDTPAHFLGAIVLDRKQTPIVHVEKRQIIDGQQRLTTLQIFLAAFRNFATENGEAAVAEDIARVVFNTGRLADPEVEKYKVWPTQLDRTQFADIISCQTSEEILRKYPLERRGPRTRKFKRRPQMIEAYFFFYEKIQSFFIGTEENPAIAVEMPLANRLDTAMQALQNVLMVVAIELTDGDDAQVIFETLNARGEPLLPADLLRNYLFQRAARGGENQETIYNTHWKMFDEPFWREEIKQGRLNRPRCDLFMQHFLASKQVRDIAIKHLFVEYKYWIKQNTPFQSVTAEAEKLAKQGRDFKRLIQPTRGDIVHQLAVFLDVFDYRTAYPLLLALLDSAFTDEQLGTVFKAIESYLVRRAVCGMSTKNYNNTFLSLVRSIGNPPNHVGIIRTLAAATGPSVIWPSDDDFRQAWNNNHAYLNLGSSKLDYILKRLNETYMTTRTEQVSVTCPLTIEHILPQTWIPNWPLPSGEQGMSAAELATAQPGNTRAVATQRRNMLLQTIGNLTIITQGLNSAQKNYPWSTKKPVLLQNSILPINLQLQNKDVWDETAITTRGQELFNRALTLWPKPTI